jgi:endonuclease/exonuclease/phosphatase family metal-dependent hydrolase
LVRLATYNIHGCVGRDGRFAPDRVHRVLDEVDADVVALQEVESRNGGGDMLDWLAAESGYRAITGATHQRRYGHYGNALLTRFPILWSSHVDLSWPGREPRGAIAADLDCTGGVLRVVGTHLGLRPAERREQVSRILPLFTENQGDREVLAGDLNEWFLWGRPLRHLRRYFDHCPSPPTFPSMRPVFALDRIYASPRSMLKELSVHQSALARVASDHLPVVATLEL